MIKCSECGLTQPEGTLFCSECGRSLSEKSPSTTNLPFSELMARRPPLPPLAEDEFEPVSGTKPLTFMVPSSRRRFTIELDDEIRVGRTDPEAEIQPELDLTDDDAIALGVSRVHASIRLTTKGLVLIDLNSTNGTLLNSHRLSSGQPYPLRSGDEIRFGDLLVHLFFDE